MYVYTIDALIFHVFCVNVQCVSVCARKYMYVCTIDLIDLKMTMYYYGWNFLLETGQIF